MSVYLKDDLVLLDEGSVAIDEACCCKLTGACCCGCCSTCFQSTEENCVGLGCQYLGDGTLCDPEPCPSFAGFGPANCPSCSPPGPGCDDTGFCSSYSTGGGGCPGSDECHCTPANSYDCFTNIHQIYGYCTDHEAPCHAGTNFQFFISFDCVTSTCTCVTCDGVTADCSDPICGYVFFPYDWSTISYT